MRPGTLVAPPLLALILTLLCGAATGAPAPDCASPAPMTFAPGRFAAELTGGLPRGQPACWTLRARAGQHLLARITSPEHNAVFQIYEPGWRTGGADAVASGRALPGTGEGQDATEFSGSLPVSGIYLFVLGTTRGGGESRLHVMVR